jgi:hypothetical protein
MNESELKPCWRCGRKTALVSESDKNITCDNINCMNFTEWYTVDEWQSHPRPTTRDDLIAGIKRLVEVSKDFHDTVYFSDITQAEILEKRGVALQSVLSDINKMISEG